MIDVRKQLPGVYFNESRDFQLLGRIFEAIFNYNKMTIDSMENLYDINTMDSKLVSLLSKTIGFESKHEYDIKNLKVICGCFYDIIKYKGTKVGIDKAISALLNAQGIKDKFYSEVTYDTRQVDIYMPGNAKDLILLKDLFDYILPVGWSFTITSGVVKDSTSYSTTITPSSSHEKISKHTYELNKVAKLNDYNATTSEGIISNEEKPAVNGKESE